MTKPISPAYRLAIYKRALNAAKKRPLPYICTCIRVAEKQVLKSQQSGGILELYPELEIFAPDEFKVLQYDRWFKPYTEASRTARILILEACIIIAKGNVSKDEEVLLKYEFSYEYKKCNAFIHEDGPIIELLTSFNKSNK